MPLMLLVLLLLLFYLSLLLLLLLCFPDDNSLSHQHVRVLLLGLLDGHGESLIMTGRLKSLHFDDMMLLLLENFPPGAGPHRRLL